MSEEIVPSVSIETLLMRRAAAVECLNRIRAAVDDYKAVGAALSLGVGAVGYSRAPHKWEESIETRDWHRKINSDDWLPWATSNVDTALWEHLMSLSGMRTFMDADAKKKWDDDIEKNQVPPLTADNITNTFRKLHGMRGELFERGVVRMFKRLSWDYKSNRPQRFGTRIVCRGIVDSRFGGPNCSNCDEIDDLLRIFNVLDGKPEPDHRRGFYQGLSKSWQETHQPPTFENEYIRVRTFKNGNGHVYLLQPAMVEQLNKILAKHHPDALPPDAPA